VRLGSNWIDQQHCWRAQRTWAEAGCNRHVRFLKQAAMIKYCSSPARVPLRRVWEVLHQETDARHEASEPSEPYRGPLGRRALWAPLPSPLVRESSCVFSTWVTEQYSLRRAVSWQMSATSGAGLTVSLFCKADSSAYAIDNWHFTSSFSMPS
jgi:hypothetical protein